MKDGRYCNDCDKQVVAFKRTPNHILHLLLSIVTAGVWVIVWIILSLKSSGESWRCSVCGSANVTSGRQADKSLLRREHKIGFIPALVIVIVLIYVVSKFANSCGG